MFLEGTSRKRAKKETQKKSSSVEYSKSQPWAKNERRRNKAGYKLQLNAESKKRKRNKFFQKTVLVLLFVGVFTSILSYFFVVVPLFEIRASVYRIRDLSNEIVSDLDQKNISRLNQNVDEIQKEMYLINSRIENFRFLRSIPVADSYWQNLETGNRMIEKTNTILDESLPELTTLLAASGFSYENIESASIQSNIENQDSAVNLILADFPEYLQLYKNLEPEILDLIAEIETIDTTYIPNLGGIDAKDRVNDLKKVAGDFPETSTELVQFVEFVPDLIGSNETKTYLIILQNEAEMRASGGLITSFGTMTISQGEVEEITLTDTWNLENFVRFDVGINTGPDDPFAVSPRPPYVSGFGYYLNTYGQDFLMNLGCGSSTMRAQDVGIYPDQYWTMNTFMDYYDNASRFNSNRFPPYDHVIVANFEFSKNLLENVQPLYVEGFGEVTADTLFEFIKEDSDDPELAFSPERKRIIEDIAQALSAKFADLEVAEAKNISETIIKSFYSRDIALYSNNQDIQAYFQQYAMDGAFEKNYQYDYFHLNEAQNCALKMNKFVRNSVTQDININSDGYIDRRVEVNWKQPIVYNEDFFLQYDISGTHLYRAWVRLMLPENSTNVESNGYDKFRQVYQDLTYRYIPQTYFDETMQKLVSDNVIRFDHRRLKEDDPLPNQDLEVSYSLPENINYNADGFYKLLIQKHPGKSWGEEYTLNINHNGNTYQTSFILDQDKVVTYREGIISVENFNTEMDWLLRFINDLPLDFLE